MSYDLYLLPLQQTDDFDAAMALLERVAAEKVDFQVDLREAAKIILQLDARYVPFEKDYATIAKSARISEEEARQRYDWIELNGESAAGEPLAQIIFHRNHVAIHWYSGTTEDEMNQYLASICRQTGLAVADPQAGSVFRLQADGAMERS